MRELIITAFPSNVLIWQSEHAKSFYCTECGTWIRTQYEGNGKAVLIECGGKFDVHTLEITEANRDRE